MTHTALTDQHSTADFPAYLTRREVEIYEPFASYPQCVVVRSNVC